jgi:hypothetical protein
MLGFLRGALNGQRPHGVDLREQESRGESPRGQERHRLTESNGEESEETRGPCECGPPTGRKHRATDSWHRS